MRAIAHLRLLLAACPLFLAGCEGQQNMLNPAGIQAQRVFGFSWFLFVVSTLVFVAVIGAMLYAAFHGRKDEETHLDPGYSEGEQRTILRWIVGSVAATVVILFIFLVADFSTGRAIASLAERRSNALTIEVVGHQWWWEVRYRDTNASRTLTTANEIHVPVGRPVRFRLSSTDVIHSFWVPNMHGKKDLIPGYTSTTWFQADEPGVFRGQCAEFCGHQHAKMGMLLIAQTPEEFNSWYEQQLRSAAPPADSVQARGQEVFLTHSCAMCHTIRGTLAGGKVAPDLTHLASRRTLASAILPNTRGHLGGWVTDPQRIKPGTRMPPNQLRSDDLQALLTYLQSLK